MPKPNDIREALERTDLAVLMKRLYLYSLARLQRKLVWRGENGGEIPGGKEAFDLVQIALEKALNGDRRWNKHKNDLYTFLKGIISSEVSHIANSPENRLERRVKTNQDNEFARVDIDHLIGDYRLEPDFALQENEVTALILSVFTQAEPEHSIAKLAICGGVTDRREIAATLGLSEHELNNAIRRMRRKIEKAYIQKDFQ